MDIIDSRDRRTALDKAQNHDTGYSEKTKGEISIEEEGEHCGVFFFTHYAPNPKRFRLSRSHFTMSRSVLDPLVPETRTTKTPAGQADTSI